MMMMMMMMMMNAFPFISFRRIFLSRSGVTKVFGSRGRSNEMRPNFFRALQGARAVKCCATECLNKLATERAKAKRAKVFLRYASFGLAHSANFRRTHFSVS